MRLRPAPLGVVCLAASLVTGCSLGAPAASLDGVAYLHDDSGEQGLHVVVRAPDGVRLEDGPLEDVYTFDTQWVERERQCYVGSDGSFEVLRADGAVVAHHDFAARPLCERDELTLTSDGELVWAE